MGSCSRIFSALKPRHEVWVGKGKYVLLWFRCFFFKYFCGFNEIEFCCFSESLPICGHMICLGKALAPACSTETSSAVHCLKLPKTPTLIYDPLVAPPACRASSPKNVSFHRGPFACGQCMSPVPSTVKGTVAVLTFFMPEAPQKF